MAGAVERANLFLTQCACALVPMLLFGSKQASKKFNKIRLHILVIKEGKMTDFMGYMCFKVIFFQNIDLKECVKNSD